MFKSLTVVLVLLQSSYVFADDRIQIQKLIDKAKSSGTEQTIKLSGRDYYLTCANDKNSYCLKIDNIQSGLKIVGEKDKTRFIIKSPRSGFMKILNSRRISLQNLVIDYETPPFIQGEITKVEGSSFDITLAPKHPTPKDPIIIHDINWIKSFGIGFIHNTGDFKLKQAQTDYVSVQMIDQVNKTSWRVMTANSGLNNWIAPGNIFTMGPRSSNAIYAQGNEGLTFDHLKIYTAPSIGLALVQNKGYTFINKLTISLPPNSTRVLSTVADGVHIQDHSGSINIENSFFQAMGDDAINTYALSAKVLNRNGNKLTLKGPFVREYQLGHYLQATDPRRQQFRFGPAAEATITALRQINPNTVEVTLNKSAAAVQVRDLIYNVNHAGPRLIVNNNAFASFRGMLRFRSSQTTFKNNIIYDPRNAKIYFGIDRGYDEGPLIGPPHLENNKILDGKLKLLGHNYTPVETWVSPTTPVTPPPSENHLCKVGPNSEISLASPQSVPNKVECEKQCARQLAHTRGHSLRCEHIVGTKVTTIKYKSSHHITRTKLIIDQAKNFHPFDYGKMYPDVLSHFTKVWNHYTRHGIKEGRSPNIAFHERFYRNKYPDVSKAIDKKEFLNGHDHFKKYGFRENRPIATAFDEWWYLGQYPEAAHCVLITKKCSSGLEFYLAVGRKKGHQFKMTGSLSEF
jgi:hypothetical protein